MVLALDLQRSGAMQEIRTTVSPVHPAPHAAAIAQAAKLPAPRAEQALPPLSRVAAISGAASGVLTAATSGFSPRTNTLLLPARACPNWAPCLRARIPCGCRLFGTHRLLEGRRLSARVGR